MSMEDEINAPLGYEFTEMPKFALLDYEESGEVSKHLYIQTFSKHPSIPQKWISRPIEEWHRLATIQQGSISIWPVFTAALTLRYLKPRHGIIERLIYLTRPLATLPGSLQAAIEYINLQLPGDLFNDLSWGSGLVKELDPFILAIRPLGTVRTLVITQGGNPSFQADHVNVEESTLSHFLRIFGRMKRRAREDVKLARNWIVRNDFLPRVDPKRFVRIEQFRNGANLVLFETRRIGGKPTSAESRRERRLSITNIKTNLRQLASEEPRELLQLRSDIEKVTLEQMLERFDEKIQQNLTEPNWQTFFENNKFILSLLFTRPVTLLHTQFHAQPSGLAGSGAQIGDFLFTEYGQGLAIVEIKKPSAPLLRKKAYRNTEVFGPSTDLAGAITQVLHQQKAMTINWPTHQYRDEGLSDSGPHSIRCIVIAGMYPKEKAHKQSFEIYRSSLRDVEVITFDELRAKLDHLKRHLNKPETRIDRVPF